MSLDRIGQESDAFYLTVGNPARQDDTSIETELTIFHT